MADDGAFLTAAARTLSPDGQPLGASHERCRRSAAPARDATSIVPAMTNPANPSLTTHRGIQMVCR